MTTAPTSAGSVVYDGQTHHLYQGRVLLNWRHRPSVSHPHGCRLCCDIRVERGDGRQVHPTPCPGCGPAWQTRRPDPCRRCGHTAHFRDIDGHPIHKACLEDELTAALRAAPPAGQRRRAA